jgi:hypothetical protein
LRRNGDIVPQNDRAAYTSGLRRLADLLDEHPELPLPMTGSTGAPLALYVRGAELDALRTFVRVVDGDVEHNGDGAFFQFVGSLDGLHVAACINPRAVAEKVTTSSTVETTEWQLRPDVLAAVSA